MGTQTIETFETTADDFPSSAALALYTAPTVALQSPAEIQRAMQQFDGEQFLAVIMGEALEKWFYSFKIGPKTVEGVSAAGAHEFARLRAEQGFAIRFPMDGVRYEEASENGERGVRAMVVARDYRSGMEAIGVAFYPYMVDRAVRDKDGNIVRVEKDFDRMAGRKAMSVAERNAILRLIPEGVIISALKVRAMIVAKNEERRQEEARVALAAAPEARRVVAGTQQTADPYTDKPVASAVAQKPQAPDGGPACPSCGGAMFDNRATKKNPSAPDFKCRNGPSTRGGPGCPGVIWPPKEGEARDETGTRRSA